MKVAVIGNDAYLARNLQNVFISDDVMSFPRLDYVDKEEIKRFDAVINFTIQPEFSCKTLSQDELLDVKLARMIKGSETKLVMISSRKVYGSRNLADEIAETAPLQPLDAYAKNKAAAEKAIQRIIPGQSLIVRVANVLGEPVNRTGYKTFMGWISESILTRGKLIVTENPETRKDFITRDYLQKALSVLIHKKVSGIINVGAGFALSLERLLTDIVGEEHIFFEGNVPPRDQFVLNVDRLHRFVSPFTPQELSDRCRRNRSVLMNYLKLHKEKDYAQD